MHIEQHIDQYLSDYEYEGDDGTYTPSEKERLLAKDAIMGLLADDAFLALVPRPNTQNADVQILEAALAQAYDLLNDALTYSVPFNHKIKVLIQKMLPARYPHSFANAKAQTLAEMRVAFDANTGHGHVRPRPDGVKARCGGPGMCKVCSVEAAQLRRQAPTYGTIAERAAAGKDAGLWDAPTPPTPDWANRRTDTVAGWVNELRTLADHPKDMPAFVRTAIQTIADGIQHVTQGDDRNTALFDTYTQARSNNEQEQKS